MAAYNQCQWLFNILGEYGFEECVKAFKDNMDTLRCRVKYEEALSIAVRQAEATTIGRDAYIKNTVARYEKVMRDSIGQARSADVYNVVPIIYNYALAEAVRDKLQAMQTEHAKIQTGKTKAKKKFTDLIQYHDKDKLLKRLHFLIDGKSGSDAGSVLCRAISLNYLTRKPTKAEYESEFELYGTWQAIFKYMSDDDKNLEKSNKIVIFEGE